MDEQHQEQAVVASSSNQTQLQNELNQRESQLRFQVRDVEDEEKNSRCCRRSRNNCCFKCAARYPRCCACCFGIILPLFLLIFFSILFGLWLAFYESPQEIRDNDNILRNRALSKTHALSLANITSLLPQVCFEAFLENKSQSAVIGRLGDLIFDLNSTHIQVSPDDGSVDDAATDQQDTNATTDLVEEEEIPISSIQFTSVELMLWMRECGEFADSLIFSILEMAAGSIIQAAISPTFNWIRCVPGSTGLDHYDWVVNASQENLKPESQAQFYEQTWNASRDLIYDETMRELNQTEPNMTLSERKLRAFGKAVNEATGDAGCELNAAASAWFWFTVMTTVGYGNQAPITNSGRTLIFTLGFFSIIKFGAVLATSGLIISAIADDIFVRLRLRFVTHPLWAWLLWGAIYYVWMFLTATVVRDWKYI